MFQQEKGRELEDQVQMMNPLTSLGGMQQTSEWISDPCLNYFFSK